MEGKSLFKIFVVSHAMLLGLSGFSYGLLAGIAPTPAVHAEENATTTDVSAEVLGASPQEQLEKQINERAQELERINQELAKVQKDLNSTKDQRVSLQRELNVLQHTANQLKLNIQSDEINLKKLGLEIQSLKFDIQDIQASLKDKRSAIAHIFRKIQYQGESEPVMIFLRHSSLAESIQEAQALHDLNAKLVVDVGNLKVLQEEFDKKVSLLSEKRGKTELHQKNLENRKIIVQEQKSERQNLLAQTKNKESVYEKQVSELRKLQQQIAEEIESLDAELRAKIDPSLLPTAGAGVLGSPVEGEPVVTQKYGGTSFAKSAYPGKWHNGIDFRASLGTPIFAAESGRVIAVGDQDSYRGCYRGAYGKFIVINHDNNLTTLYAHLSRYVVKTGDKIERGKLMGYAGRSGYATGPHLHFTVFAQPTFYMGPSRTCGPMPFGGDLNPERYL